MIRRLIYVSNALDDDTRRERDITTDSPAASRKIFATSHALRQAGVRAIVLSTGRGRASGSWRYYAAKVRRVRGVPVVYMPFVRLRIVSELLSVLSLCWWVLRLHRKAGQKTFFFYNRTSAYIAPLLLVALLRDKRVLDLEDGNLREQPSLWAATSAAFRTLVYRILCSQGTVLANAALGARDVEGPTLCYYGVTTVASAARDWSEPLVTVLIGGTVGVETGADMLWTAISDARATADAWTREMELVVTGKGDFIEHFRRLEGDGGHPRVRVLGRLDDVEYDEVLRSARVGLALKPMRGALADTTFPSKVVEMAGAGMLVLTTNVSDVQNVLGDGALYLDGDDSRQLVQKLRWIVENRDAARSTALRGKNAVHRWCDVRHAGSSLADFLFIQAP